MKTKLAKNNGGFATLWEMILLLLSLGAIHKAMELLYYYFHFTKP